MTQAKDLKLEILTIRIPKGTLDGIDKLLQGGELRSAFCRTAIEHEIERRRPKPVIIADRFPPRHGRQPFDWGRDPQREAEQAAAVEAALAKIDQS